MNSIEWQQPLWLLALPLAALPLLRNRRETLAYPHIGWLPTDRLGRAFGALWRVLASLAMLAIVVALASPELSRGEVLRTGRGAEIVVLMDRSRSMDERMLPADWRTIDPILRRHQASSRGEPKGEAARRLLSAFVTERPDDRFALMYFSTRPMLAVPFTPHDDVLQAGIVAGGIGRGLADTDVGRALLAAIQQFQGRPYGGSRIILLVSDGAARLDEDTRRRIAAGLQRERVSVYWLYLRSVQSPSLGEGDEAAQLAIPELALHRFFSGLRTPYRAYQADNPEDLEKAVADVGREQHHPLDIVEQVPRRPLARPALAVAIAACAGLLLLQALRLRRWTP
jgi:mxaC protein